MAQIARCTVFSILILLASFFAVAQSSLGNSESKPSALSGTYLIFYRTPIHVNVSKAEVFDSAVSAVIDYFNSKHVVVIQDPERGLVRTEDTMSTQSMGNLARDATADTFLLITVDRPISAWIKLTVEAYDLSGTKLWEESASYGGGINGKAAIDKTMKKLQPKLDAHLGKAGLPVKG